MAAVVGWMAGKLADTIGGWIAEKFLGTTIDKLTKREDGSASSPTAADLERAVEGLKSRLDGIKAVLQDAGKREIQEASVKSWLNKIKLLAYDAEDVLEDYENEMLLYQIEGKAAPESQASSSSSSSSRKRKREEAEISPKMAKDLVDRINNINDRFDVIAKDREALHLKEEDGPRREDDSETRLPTGSRVIESDIYGREDDKTKIIDLLLSGDDKFTVLPIVGMGGLGKTTLAQLVYKDPRIDQLFNLKRWICVSDDFDIIRLTKVLIESFTQQRSDLTELSMLQDIIAENLASKKVFLVLDDVWNENQSKWDLLKAPLLQAEKIKIIVTTRNDQVAGIMQTMTPHYLKPLNEEESWFLFERHAFVGQDPNEHPNLVEIGKQIVKKCHGLPLAIKVVGGLLQCKGVDEQSWEEILQSNLWKLPEAQTKIKPALQLSYRHMPHYLKPCFLYSSLFPKDYIINEDMLVQLWVAQGYITQPTEIKSIEDVGREYVEELQRRSLLQSAGIGQIRMHDLVHDMALSISGNECYQVTIQSDIEIYNIPNEVRHLHITMWRPTFPHSLISCLPKALRTVVLNGIFIVTLDTQFGFPLENLGCLRALILRCDIEGQLPNSIGHLKHLRHLSIFESCRPEYRPLLSSDKFFIKTPINYSIFRRPINYSIFMPCGFGKLIRLETLNCSVTVGRGARHFGIEELKSLVNLRGDLCITGLRNVAHAEDAMEANLHNKHRIKKMVLDWDEHCRNTELGAAMLDRDEEQCNNAELEAAVLDGLRPCTNLIELEIMGYSGTRFSSWMADACFSQLVSVKLMSIKNCERLPALGQLLSLKKLIICSMPCLRSVGPEFCRVALPTENIRCMASFPSLESLSFAGMPKWEEWCGVLDRDFPRICDLVIIDCPKLRTLSLLRSTLQVLEIVNAPQLSSPVVSLHNFSSLKRLVLQDCPQLRFPPDEPLPPTLQVFSLRLCDMRNIVLLQGTQPALDTLKIENCALLELVSGLHNSSSLRTLCLKDCPQLRSPPDEPLPSTLQKLSLENCTMLELMSGLHNLSSLRKLCLQDCPQLRFPPDEPLPPTLQELTLKNCAMLELILGLHNLSSLQKLCLQDCPQLRFSPDEPLPPTLEELSLQNCAMLELMSGLHNFSSLRKLCLKDCPQLRFPPDEPLPPTLQELTLENCAMLELMSGLHNLSSLQKLYLQDCPQLRFPPGEPVPPTLEMLSLKNCALLELMLGLHNLFSLRRLCLRDCPQLRLSLDSSEPLIKTLAFLEVASEGLEEAVLDSFRACTRLFKLEIEGYYGARFPCWLGNLSFSRLTIVTLADIKNCECLPALGQLPSLGMLRIKGMRRLTCVNTRTAGSFPSLEGLSFGDMPEWEEWCEVGDGDFPRLAYLRIEKCPKLRSLPLLQTLSALEDLQIVSCDLLESVSGLQNLSSLRQLELRDCSQLRLSTDEPLPPTLSRLTVERCGGLSILPLHHTPTALEDLCIEDCPQLSSLAVGLQALTSLKTLSLKRCPKLQIPPSERLSSIPDGVDIADCPELIAWCQAQGFTHRQGITTLESDDDSSS